MNLRFVDDTVHILTREKNLGSIPPFCKKELITFDAGTSVNPKDVLVKDLCMNCLMKYFQTNPIIKVKKKRSRKKDEKRRKP